MVQVVLVVVQVKMPPAPSSAVAVYPVSGEPPLSGAVHEMASVVLLAITLTPEGDDGTATGVADSALLEAEDPATLLAVTDMVYVTPFERPLIVQLSDVAVHVKTPPLPSSAVATYPVSGAPPVADGAVHDTVTAWFPAVTDVRTGALGATAKVALAALATDDSEVPAAVTACTRA
jgi:hypothetical protein